MTSQKRMRIAEQQVGRLEPATSIQWPIIAFILAQIVCQLFLSLGGADQSARIVARVVSLGSGLLLLVAVPGSSRWLGLLKWVWLGGLVLAIKPIPPGDRRFSEWTSSNSPANASILSPLIWISRLSVSKQTFTNVLILLWSFHTLSAAVGVLQVFYPDAFQSELSSKIMAEGEGYVQSLMITLDSGARVFRPMGLTDVPGGACVSGMYAVLFGAGLLTTAQRLSRRLLYSFSIAAGTAAVELSQVRASAVAASLSLVALGLLLLQKGEIRRLLQVGALVGLSTLAGSLLALSVAQDQVSSRFSTLVEDTPDSVYQSNRGSLP